MSAVLLRLAGRGDHDLARDDICLDRGEIGLERGRYLALELVEGRQTGAVVLQDTDVAASRERAAGRRSGVLGHGVGEVLGHAGQEVLAVLGGARAAVRVDPYDADVAACGLSRRTQIGRA